MDPYEVASHRALHIADDRGHDEQTTWLVTRQKVPNSSSVTPPDCGQDQLSMGSATPSCALRTCTGAVVQIVAASFHALHAGLSPVLNGYIPPLAVSSVAL